MKKLLLLSLFVMLITVCLANFVTFTGFSFTPVLGENTVYDYFIGAYDGYPMRIYRGEPLSYVHMTYMSGANSNNVNRYQMYATALLNGQAGRSGRIADTQSNQGFGTMAFDPRNGNAFFTWHQSAPEPQNATSIMDVKINLDNFTIFEVPGGGLANSEGTLCDNDHEDNLYFQYQWPVIHIGDSPVEHIVNGEKLSMKRIYIFTSNGGRSRIPINPEDPDENPDGLLPASSVMLFYTDIPEDMQNGIEGIIDGSEDGTDLVRNYVWTQVELPYLLDITTWEPVDYENPEEDAFARAYPSYAVSPTGGTVVVAGSIGFDDTHPVPEWWDEDRWGVYEDHDHFVLVNRNYGEGDWTLYVYDLKNEYTEYTGYQQPYLWHPGNFNTPEGPYMFIHEDEDGYDEWLDMYGWRTARGTLNHKNITIDRRGILHLPAYYYTFFTDEDAEAENMGYAWFGTYVISDAQIDLATGDLRLYTVSPTQENQESKVAHLKKSAFTFDRDQDGYWDHDLIDWDEDGEGIWSASWYPSNPYQFYDDEKDMGKKSTDNFHYNFVRMTEDNNGVMAMLWLDTVASYYAQRGSEYYAPYLDQPEVFISISLDSGLNWSDPYSFSALDEGFTQLVNPGTSPSMMYLADKVQIINENTVQVWIMYLQNAAFGSIVQGDGTNAQSYVRYAALEFDISQLPRDVKDSDRTIKPVKLLSQNYPNPFNPNTTIQFDLPRASKAKLSIYNVKGQLVNTLVNDNLVEGTHRIVWNGKDSNNRDVASGVYFYRLETNNTSEIKKMVLMK